MAGIYVHIPFCRQRCSYCDFYFVTGSKQIDRFVDAVVREISSQELAAADDVVETIYFGGGTPSRLSIRQLAQILEAVTARFRVDSSPEITIEVNPEDLDAEYLNGLSRLGFNRLSIGVQSVRSTDLEFMRRGHSVAHSSDVVIAARRAGFDRFSIDLIFGLPGQSVDDWMQGVTFALAHEVPHISTYGLTVEPRTLLNKWIADGHIAPLDQDVMAEMYLATIDRLESAGYEHYEISSFALPGSVSRHNSSYWSHENYLGFGPSAHSLWWTERATRWSNVRNLGRYLEAVETGTSPIESSEDLAGSQLAQEHVMLSLRTSSGVDRAQLRSTYGFEFSQEGEERISDLQRSDKLIDTGSRISLTRKGRLVSDAVVSLLCDEAALLPVAWLS